MPDVYVMHKNGTDIPLIATERKSLFKYYPSPQKGTYKYTNIQKLIEENLIRVTSSVEINDVTDCNPHFVDDLKINTLRNYYRHLATASENLSVRRDFAKRFPNEKAIRQIKRVTKKDRELFANTIGNSIRTTGFISFAQSGLNQLLWSHYAESHSGICVEFETKSKKENPKVIEDFPITAFTTPIEYSDRRAIVRLDENLPRTSHEALRDATLMKSKIWEYEQEWRFITHASDSRIYRKGELIDIGPKSIKSISFGIRSSQETKNIIKEFLLQKNHAVTTFQISMQNASYDLRRKKISI